MESPLHGYSPMRQFASASNIHSPGGAQSHSRHQGASGLTPTPTHSRLASSPMHGAIDKQQHRGGTTAGTRRYNPKSPLPPRTPSNTKQRPGHRPAKSLDFSADAASQQQESASESSVSKYYRREDRLATPGGDNEQTTDTMHQKFKLSQQLRNCDTLTTAQETMSNQHSLYASSSLSASASGSNPAANTGTSSAKNGARHQGHHHHHQPILISTHHHAEQYQGIEIFSPQVRSERPSRCYDDEVGEDDTISDASSISTAMSTLAHDDPLQRQVKITGIQRAIRNYEIIQASSSESTDDDDDIDAMQSKAKSLMDVAGTFSADSDEDDEYRMLDKMSDQTKMFQEWLTMGLGGGGVDCNGDTGNKDEAKASWMWKPAPLDIPATLERQSDGRGGLLNSLGGANSSRRSLLSRGLVPEESSKTMMAEHNRGIEQKHFRQHSSSAQEFLQSAEKLEQRARKREEERGRSGRERDDAADGGMSSILRMMGESFFKCTGY